MKTTYKIFSLLSALSLMTFALPVQASEVTGNLSTGLITGVQGTVVVAPSATPSAGTYTSIQNVILSAADSSSIHYTSDNSTPTCATGSIYSGAIIVATSKTIKAIACYPSNTSSTVSSFAYALNLNVSPSDLSTLLTGGELQASGDSLTSTPSITVAQDLIISVTETGGTNTVSVPANTVITTVSGANFDATALTATDVSNSSLSGLGTGVVVDGALQWGIVDLGLQFSSPITLSIFVGTSLNGQTLNIVRSTSNSGGWTSDGIVSPATCVVTSGVCTFQATKASYYVVTNTTTVTPPSTGSGGGGGGGGGGNGSIVGLINRATPATPAVPGVGPAIPATPSVQSRGQVLGASTFNFTRGLGVGSKGNDVTKLQNRLTSEGVYTGPITGYFGPLTFNAVKRFQKKYGISQVGTVGPKTRLALNASVSSGNVLGVSTSAEEQAKNENIRIQLQAALSQLTELQAKLNTMKQ